MIRHIVALLSFALLASAPAAAGAHELVLAVEHAEVVRLPAEASAVIVGNPSIADALVHDGRTLVVTGRLQGRTNVIALDRVGRIIYSREVAVTSPTSGQVALFRGTDRYMHSCADVCDAIPRVGDQNTRTAEMGARQRDRQAVADEAVGDAPMGSAPQR